MIVGVVKVMGTRRFRDALKRTGAIVQMEQKSSKNFSGKG